MKVVKPLAFLPSDEINLFMGLNDAILLSNIGSLSPPQYLLEIAAHYETPKGSHLILIVYTNSLH